MKSIKCAVELPRSRKMAIVLWRSAHSLRRPPARLVLRLREILRMRKEKIDEPFEQKGWIPPRHPSMLSGTERWPACGSKKENQVLAQALICQRGTDDVDLLTMTQSSNLFTGTAAYFIDRQSCTRRPYARYGDEGSSTLIPCPTWAGYDCLIHTGSKKNPRRVVLTASGNRFDETRVLTSSKKLWTLSSARPVMLAKNKTERSAMVVRFGVGFTAIAGIMNFN